MAPLTGQAAQASAAGHSSDEAVVAGEQPGILVQPAKPSKASQPLSGVRDGAAVAPTQAVSSPEGSRGAGEGQGQEEGAPRLQAWGGPSDVVPDSESEGETDDGRSVTADAERLAGQQRLIAVEQEQHAKVWILCPHNHGVVAMEYRLAVHNSCWHRFQQTISASITPVWT